MFKALIIEDERPAWIAIAKLGNWAKYHLEPPLRAANGLEGMQTLRETRAALVFVDMQMPVMGGIAFLEQAQKEFPSPSHQYIVVSGHDDFHYAQAALHHGATEYLLKPVVEDELNAAIEKAVLRLDPSLDVSAKAACADPTPEEIVDTIRDFIDKNYQQTIRVADFASRYFFSKEYLSRLFKQRHGANIYEYLQQVRMSRAKELLLNPDMKVKDIAQRTGFEEKSYFSKAFRTYFGVSPTAFRAEKTGRAGE